MLPFTVITFQPRGKIEHISNFVLSNFVTRLVNLTRSGGLRLWSCTDNPVHAARRRRRDEKVPEEGNSVLPRHQLPDLESGRERRSVHSRSLLREVRRKCHQRLGVEPPAVGRRVRAHDVGQVAPGEGSRRERVPEPLRTGENAR